MQQEDYYHYEQTVPVDYEYEMFQQYQLDEYIDHIVKEATITSVELLSFRTGLPWDYEYSPSVLLRIAQNKVEYNELRVTRAKELNNKNK